MLTLSASRIKLYLDCRPQYYDRYHLGMKDIENTSALMGKALHTAIEYHYTKPHRDSKQVYYRYMTRMYDWWIKSGKEFKEYEPFSQLLTTGRNIIAAFPFHEYNPRAQEVDFTVPLFDVCNLHGFIDMELDRGFVDFKSSKRKSKSLADDWQFIIYAYAYWKRHGVWPAYGIWHHLRTNEKIQWDIDPDVIHNKVLELAALCAVIAADDFKDMKPCAKCKPWCRYKGKKAIEI